MLRFDIWNMNLSVESNYIYKRLPRKSIKSGHANLVLITSTDQVELPKLNFYFFTLLDNIRAYFLQVLRNCQQIIFITLSGLCLLSRKKPAPVPN